jgi:hypothetical protein
VAGAAPPASGADGVGLSGIIMTFAPVGVVTTRPPAAITCSSEGGGGKGLIGLMRDILDVDDIRVRGPLMLHLELS